MADWDYIECGFNAADETINFGTRNFAGIDNIYETSTLALIKNTEQVDFKIIKYVSFIKYYTFRR